MACCTPIIIWINVATVAISYQLLLSITLVVETERTRPFKISQDLFQSNPCDALGSCIYRLRTPTLCARSDFVCIKYRRHPMFLLNSFSLITSSSSAVNNFNHVSIGMWTASLNQASSSILVVYLSCFKITPSLS